MAAKTKVVKRAQRRPSDEVTLKITVKASGVTPVELVRYVAQAVDGWSGQCEADDPHRGIRVVEIQRLAWVTDVVL